MTQVQSPGENKNRAGNETGNGHEELYDSIARSYDQLFPLKETRIDFVRRILGPPPRDILDIGCATGQLALELSRMGHRVRGIDKNAAMIRAAQKKAEAESNIIKFRSLDMMKIQEEFSPGEIDTFFCFGNTLAHLDGPKEIARFFASIHRIVCRFGALVVQVVNYDRILAENVTSLPTLETVNFTFQRRYEYDKSLHRIRFHTTLTDKQSGRIVERNVTPLYPVTRDEMETLFTDAGFTGIRFFGSESPDPWQPTSPATIALGRK